MIDGCNIRRCSRSDSSHSLPGIATSDLDNISCLTIWRIEQVRSAPYSLARESQATVDASDRTPDFLLLFSAFILTSLDFSANSKQIWYDFARTDFCPRRLLFLTSSFSSSSTVLPTFHKLCHLFSHLAGGHVGKTQWQGQAPYLAWQRPKSLE